MTLLASAHAETAAPVQGFFERWADMATWPEWNADTEWVRLTGPFVEGATGTLKPKGGPKVSFTVTALNAERFTDVSKLVGARLIFDHRIGTTAGRTTLDVSVSIEGPLRRVWIAIMGKGLRASAQRDLDALVVVVEAALPAA